MSEKEIKSLSLELRRSREINTLLAEFIARHRLSKPCLLWLKEQGKKREITQLREDVALVLGYRECDVTLVTEGYALE